MKRLVYMVFDPETGEVYCEDFTADACDVLCEALRNSGVPHRIRARVTDFTKRPTKSEI